MNQHDQMREALEPIWYMHDNHCFTKLEGTVEQCLATLERLLNEGETYGMLCSKRKGFECVHQKGTDDRVNFLSRCKVVLEQALAHVNETPKNEHGSDDVLKPCPFCGSQPEFPDGSGTCYDLECSDCGQAGVSIQISDLMSTEERATAKFDIIWHEAKYVERAKQEAIKRWNTRAAERAPLVRLTDEEIEALRHKTFSTNNPFCPCDAKTMRKAANAIMDAMIAANQ